MGKSNNLSIESFLSVLFSIVFMVGTNHMILGQVSEGGVPYSFSNPIPPNNIQTVTMGFVDVDALRAEDEAEMQRGEPVPYRFGYAFEVDLGLDNAGTWTELPNGDRIWRLRIISPGAYSINLIYDDFWLPDGAKLFIYTPDHSMVIGAFTSSNNKEHGKFSTAPVKGNISILEYYEPAYIQDVKEAGRLNISTVVHAYRNLFGPPDSGVLNKVLNPPTLQGFGHSAKCEINVNCSQGAPWANEKRAVVMILLSNGTRLCSGAMINNVEQDLKPYLLTAFHCIDRNPPDGFISDSERNDAEQWIIMFNYESPNCSNSDGPTNQTVSGTMLKASNSATDFALLCLYSPPPRSYNVRYAGWSRSYSYYPPSSAVGIHHPQGDIKKIAFEYQSPTKYTYPGTPYHFHWQVIFDIGTAEPGSSGSPLFDPYHRIIGQLRDGSGPPYCSPKPQVWYGRFSISWNYGNTKETRLRDWLDPQNTWVTTLNGMNDPRPYPPTNVYISGYVGDFLQFTGPQVQVL